MAFQMAEAYVQLSQRGFSSVQGSINAIGSSLTSMARYGSLAVAGVTAAGVASGAALSATAVGIAASAERSRVEFETLLGSAGKARTMLENIERFSAATPFSLTGIQDAGRLLLNYGVAAGDVMGDIDALSNVASGNEQKLQRLSLAYGQVAAKGRLMGQEVIQMVEAGFNPLTVIAERTGESMTDLQKRMERGEVAFSEVSQAFRDITSEGGRFYQMNVKQSQTMLGLWSTFKDNLSLILKDIGFGYMEAFNLRGAMANAVAFVGELRTAMGPIIDEIVPSIQSSMQAAGEAIDGLWGTLAGGQSASEMAVSALQAVADGVVSVIDSVTFTIDNWGTLWQLAVEYTKLAMENAYIHVGTFFENAVILGQWFVDNWRDILSTVAEMTTVVFSNAAHNAQQALRPAQTAIAETILRAQAVVMGTSTADLNDQIATLHEDAQRAMKPYNGLLDGFKSDIKTMPDFAEAATKDTNAAIEGLMSDFKFREKPQRQQQTAAEALDKASAEKPTAADAAAKAAKEKEAQPRMQERSGAFMALDQFTKSLQSTAVKTQVDLQKKANEHLGTIADAVTGKGIKVQGGPAVAG